MHNRSFHVKERQRLHPLLDSSKRNLSLLERFTSPSIRRCLYQFDRESGSIAVKKFLGIFFYVNQLFYSGADTEKNLTVLPSV